MRQELIADPYGTNMPKSEMKRDVARAARAARALAGLSSADRNLLVETIEKAQPAITLHDLSKRVAEACALDMAVVGGIVSGMAALVEYASRATESIDPLSTHLARLASTTPDDREPDSGLVGLFRRLLVATSLVITAKALAVMWGHGNAYYESHIITQVRPLFSGDVREKSGHAAIVHELQLEYRDLGDPKAVRLTMDRSQLFQLAEVVQRAVAKEQSLRANPSFHFLPTSETLDVKS
jgi:hypothetical protein